MMHGSYNEKGDRWVERLLSLRETCRLRGRPTFPVLVDAVTCSFYGQQPDVSWIVKPLPPEQLQNFNQRLRWIDPIRIGNR